MEQEPTASSADFPHSRDDAMGANGAVGHDAEQTVAVEPTRQRRRRVSQPSVSTADTPIALGDPSQPSDVLPEPSPPRRSRRPRSKLDTSSEPKPSQADETSLELNGARAASEPDRTTVDDLETNEAIIKELLKPTVRQHDVPTDLSHLSQGDHDLGIAVAGPEAFPIEAAPADSPIPADGAATVLDVPYTPPGILEQDQPVTEAPVYEAPTFVDPTPITLDMSPPDSPAPPSISDTASPPPPPPPPDGEEEGASMTIIEHLEELRMRLVWCLGAITIGSFVGWFLTPTVIEHAKIPLVGKADFITLTVFGAFVLNIKMAFFLGICISMPMTLYQVWSFVAPGLTRNEKQYARPFVALGSVLFIAGAAVGYFIFPLGVSFALTFNTGLQIKPTIEANGYITFIGTIMVLFGITFELPVFMVFLSLIGLLSSRILAQRRRLAFVLIFIVSTLITPGADPVSPVVLGVMLCGLYELGVWLTRAVGR